MDEKRKVDFITIVTKFIEIQYPNQEIDDDQLIAVFNEARQYIKELQDDEADAALKELKWKYKLRAIPGASLQCDYNSRKWYDDKKSAGKITSKFWARYSNYLITDKGFSPNIVNQLGNDTLDNNIMNFLVDPNLVANEPVLKRGLIIGDVQSGKTSTYIGLMCKAADAGYKVFILLTGMIEALRRQTQERVEEGFVGIDMSSNDSNGKRVGVGINNKELLAMSMTSRIRDFVGDNDKIAIALEQNKSAIVFVIKKNTSSLRKLTNWLVDLNADLVTKKIDMPMLLIDDEADNASINTSGHKEDPTTINRLVRNLANVFTKSSYVGFTATPFANVFIDPETTQDMETQDLFPEDFIVALPVPNDYIGASKIFSEGSEFHSQLEFIYDAGRTKSDGYPFYMNHDKHWKGQLPESLTDAIYTFYIANAIMDLRGKQGHHRSMLINISRFIDVQKYIYDIVQDVHDAAYRSLKYNLSSCLEETVKDPILDRMYNNWVKHYKGRTEFEWDEIANVLYESVEPITIKAVNSKSDMGKIEYKSTNPQRVIVIGGLSLSRGLTLEGLITSYLFRSTSTYDVLMQMGRFFGYRHGYEDLFRIWTERKTADWYAEIAEATDELKADMRVMQENEQKPREFGIRVRNQSKELSITAYNKMRNTGEVIESCSYFGGFFDTPYLSGNAKTNINNYIAVENLLKSLSNAGILPTKSYAAREKGNYVFRNVPKIEIIRLLKRIDTSHLNKNFDIRQIVLFLEGCNDAKIDMFDIGIIEGAPNSNKVSLAGLQDISLVKRGNCQIVKSDNPDHQDRLDIGKRGKLSGATADGLLGLNETTAKFMRGEAEKRFNQKYIAQNGIPPKPGCTIPVKTWFEFIEDRNPLLLLYFLDIYADEDNVEADKNIAAFKHDMHGIPVVGFAIGFPQNPGNSAYTVRYKVNKCYNPYETGWREELNEE